MKTRETKWNSLKVGIVFIIGIVLMLGLGLLIGKNSGLLRSFSVLIFVSDAEGLAENNFVSISGKKVGTVKKMTLMQKDNQNGVKVELSIQNEFSPLLSTNAKARIKSIGILGDKYVDIVLGNTPGVAINEYDYLPYERESGLSELTSSANSVMKNLEQLLTKINHGEGAAGKFLTSDEFSKTILNIVQDVSIFSKRLTQNEGTVGMLLNDKKFASNINDVVASLQAVMNEIKSGKGSIGKLVMEEKLYTDLSQSIEKLSVIITNIERGHGTAGQFVANKELYQNINKSVLSIDSLLKDVKKNPSRYINIKVF